MMNRHWTASYGAIPTEIDPDSHASVNQLLDEAVRRYADKPAFRTFGQSVSYSEVNRLATALAGYLQHVVGVKKADRVAVMLPNLLAFPVVFMAIAKLGAIQVNVNPLYAPRELAHQLNDSGSEVIVVYDGSTPALAEVIVGTAIRYVITVGAADCLPVTRPDLGVDPCLGNAVSLPVAIEQGALLPPLPVPLAGEDLLFLLYTGGTTGPSKGAALSHRNLIANIQQFRAFMPEALRPGAEVVVTALPLYHIFALMVNFLSYFAVGAQNWLVANPRDLNALIDVLRAARPTVFTGVNTLYAGLASHPRLAEVDWSRLRLALGGGAAVMRATSDRWQAVTGGFILEGYGLSETSPIVCVNPMSIAAFSGATGLPLPSTDVLLLDDDDHEVAIGEPGEICVRGPQVMRGYWAQPQTNAEAFTRDGYFRTGDVGVFDQRGFLRIVDRKKDMVVVSGFNVYPTEVESVASSFPGVLECACVGVPDDKTGEALVLHVVKAPRAEVAAERLIAHCRAALAGYKVPKIVCFEDALPKSTVGKVLRRALRRSA